MITYLLIGALTAAAITNECFQPEWYLYSSAIKLRVTVYVVMLGLMWPSTLIMCALWSISARGRNFITNWLSYGKFSTKEMGR